MVSLAFILEAEISISLLVFFQELWSIGHPMSQTLRNGDTSLPIPP